MSTPNLIDTHCHIDFPQYTNDVVDSQHMPLAKVLSAMKEHNVTRAICISVNVEDWPRVHKLALTNQNLYCTAGVHPDYKDMCEPTIEELVNMGKQEKVVAIGECGLDYFHCPDRPKWQEERFSRHIAASRVVKKPLVIHTRDSGTRLLEMLRTEKASPVDGGAGGVLHCFTDTWDIAKGALDLGFYISFSGIVTFKNALQIHDVAKKVPDDRFLIETDSPYLTPHPYRGRLNHPALVHHVAEQMSHLRGQSFDTIAKQSTKNAERLFNLPEENT